ncbi:MAG: hypothetical protein WAL59_27195 [Roseiarcus sp.]
MRRYNFEILQGETTSAIERNVPIADAKGLWRRIGAIASLQNSGMIKVTDEMGGIVALIGVTTATYLCAASFLSDYMSP